jgi:polyisoprenoid-binding protein YceI
MNKIILVITFIFYGSVVNAQTIFKAVEGEITFYSYAPLEDIKATSTQVNSFINILTNEVVFLIPMRSFQFQKSLMQEHFNEKYVESDKFPQATYKGKIVEKVDFTMTGKLKLMTTGKLNIHGEERDISESGELEIKKDTLILETKMFIAIADYKIAIPQLLFNNIADTVEVKLKAIYIPFKKD